MGQSKFDKKQDAKRHPKKQAVVPCKTNRAIKCARSHIYRDRADYPNRVKTGQRRELSGEKQNHSGKTNGNKQRIGWNAVAVESPELSRHLTVTRHHVEQSNHRHDGGIGRAQAQKEENNSK